MAIIVGIDEAGYGPVLGPLLVSRCALQVPDELVGADLWKVLDRAVARGRKHLRGRIHIADSKKVFSRKSGLGPLGRTVLSLINAANMEQELPRTVDCVLSRLCPDCKGRLAGYPWYEKCAQKAIEINREDITLAAGVLSKALAESNVRILSLGSLCFDAGHYNRLIDAVQNKSAVLFTAVCGHIQTILQNGYPGGKDVQIQFLIDRQGGRVSYHTQLRRMFPAGSVDIIKQNPSTSSYILKSRGKEAKVHFTVKADDRFLPVAVASLLSKYLREILMGMLNDYFLQYDGWLKPTAGYWTDGNRFIKDISPHIDRLGIEKNRLIRQK